MTQFNVDAVVMTAAELLKVYVTETETFTLPNLPGVTQTAFHFTSANDATKFAERCMSERLPARAYGSIVIVLHE
jgi:hypothetical protein